MHYGQEHLSPTQSAAVQNAWHRGHKNAWWQGVLFAIGAGMAIDILDPFNTPTRWRGAQSVAGGALAVWAWWAWDNDIRNWNQVETMEGGIYQR
jgi:hypothetical protein